MNEQTHRQEKVYQIRPIGYVRQTEAGFHLDILEAFRPALKQLEHFSHVIVLWWADQHDNEADRTLLQTRAPYAADKVTGVFACRSEYRPNPVAVTTCELLEVNEQAGIVRVPYMDAYDGTPIIDLKAYFSVCDRVREARLPEWLSDWPEWLEDGASLVIEVPEEYGG